MNVDIIESCVEKCGDLGKLCVKKCSGMLKLCVEKCSKLLFLSVERCFFVNYDCIVKVDKMQIIQKCVMQICIINNLFLFLYS